MSRGDRGRDRSLERIVSIPLLIVAVRIMVPLQTAVYTSLWLKLVFTPLVAGPAVWLLCARGPRGRKRALAGVIATYVYTGLLGLALDPSRFPAAVAWLALGAVAGHLYVVTAAGEIQWTQDGSPPSSPPPQR
jgi:hypothetical protein